MYHYWLNQIVSLNASSKDNYIASDAFRRAITQESTVQALVPTPCRQKHNTLQFSFSSHKRCKRVYESRDDCQEPHHPTCRLLGSDSNVF
ncbi:hypothetical protein ABKN59_009026 [Abortiporus biennis]